MAEAAGTDKRGRIARLRERRQNRRQLRAWRRERRKGKGLSSGYDPMLQPQNSKHEGNFSKSR